MKKAPDARLLPFDAISGSASGVHVEGQVGDGGMARVRLVGEDARSGVDDGVGCGRRGEVTDRGGGLLSVRVVTRMLHDLCKSSSSCAHARVPV